jgi:hypothetical protein
MLGRASRERIRDEGISGRRILGGRILALILGGADGRPTKEQRAEHERGQLPNTFLPHWAHLLVLRISND